MSTTSLLVRVVDWVGRSLRHNGLVVDLSAMRSIEIDPEKRIAKVSGDARASDVISATAPHRLLAVTGNCGAVGMAGPSMAC